MSDQLSLVEFRPKTTNLVGVMFEGIVCDSLVCLNPKLSIRSLLRCHGEPAVFPEPDRQSISFNRNLFVDFRHFENLVQYRLAAYTSEVRLYEDGFTAAQRMAFASDTDHVNNLVRTIQSRGGQVVFVSLPVTGPYIALQNSQHPRSQYWDRFAALTNALCVDGSDCAGHFACPDYSHLDGRDSPVFTSQLHAALVRRGVFAKCGETRLVPFPFR